jgi:hypothetical protein
MMLRVSVGIPVLLVVGCASTTATPPCGGTQPLGCSIPAAVLVASKDYEAQADKFHNACVTHDLCYRHGEATYGVTRKECDVEFYDNMKAACSGFKGLGVLDPEEFAKCQFAAKQNYEAVRTHGEKHFRSATSTSGSRDSRRIRASFWAAWPWYVSPAFLEPVAKNADGWPQLPDSLMTIS